MPKLVQPAKKNETTINTAAGTKARKKAEKKGAKLPIIYPEHKAAVLKEEKALTADQAKELIGWEEESEGVTFGKSFLFTLDSGKKVRTTRNTHNRDFQLSNALLVKQEILRGKWQLNGENLIVGDRGNILSAQHRLIGLILAVEDWKKDPEKYPYWKEEPRMESFIAYGISEEDEVVNTIDTGKPRTLADVIFRSIYFADTSPADRRVLARMTQYAIRLLWDRTGADSNAYDPGLFRTHAEAIDFLKRHPRTLDSVKHIFEENKQDGDSNAIGGVIRSTGDASGLLYLMGCDASDSAAYLEGEPPNEKLLNWKDWDKAQDFFVHLAQNHAKLKPVKAALTSIREEFGREPSRNESLAVVIKAWEFYRKGETPTPKDLKLEYKEDDDGVKILTDFPTIGGIDLGREDYDAVIEDETSEEDVKEQAKEIRKKNLQAKANGSGKSPSGPLHSGDTVWVVEPDGGHWRGKLTDNIKSGKALVKIGQGFAGAGKVIEVSADKLQREQPIPGAAK